MAGDLAAPFFARWLDPDQASRAAEWAIRIVLAYVADPAPGTDLTDPDKPYGKFLAEMPIAARVGKWLFCHAGLYPGPTWPEFSVAAIAVPPWYRGSRRPI